VFIDPTGRDTVGLCVGGSVSVIGIHIGGEVCVLVASSGQLGVSVTGEVSASSESAFGGSASVGVQVTNAPCIGDLNGSSLTASASFAGSGVSVSGDSEGGAGGEVFAGIGYGAPEISGGVSTTVTAAYGGCSQPTGGNPK
jgi:hypothetical protein